MGGNDQLLTRILSWSRSWWKGPRNAKLRRFNIISLPLPILGITLIATDGVHHCLMNGGSIPFLILFSLCFCFTKFSNVMCEAFNAGLSVAHDLITGETKAHMFIITIYFKML